MGARHRLPQWRGSRVALEGVDVPHPTDEVRLGGVGVLDDERSGADRQVLFMFNGEVERRRDLDRRRPEILMSLLHVTLGKTFGAEV